jgi:hypothetical protein
LAARYGWTPDVIERLPRPAVARLVKAMRRGAKDADGGKWEFLPMED